MITADSEALENELAELVAVKLPARLKEAMEKACLVVEADAKNNAPSVDGTLRASITHSVESEDDSVIGYVGSNLDYAPYVHQGTGIFALMGNGRKQVPWTYYDAKRGEFVSTSGIEPHPFIQEAIEKNRAGIIDYFGGLLNG